MWALLFIASSAHTKGIPLGFDMRSGRSALKIAGEI
jgi:hypothetical protein